MIRKFIEGLSERGQISLDIEAVSTSLKKSLLVMVPIGALLMKYAAMVFNPLTLLACFFVGLMLVVDVITGIVYHTYIKEPPSSFDKRKVYKSIFEFSLLMVAIIIFSVFKLVMMQFEHTKIASVVPYVDGGISGMFMTFLFAACLILFIDFIDRSAKMGMPGAEPLNKWLRGILSRTIRSGGENTNNDA